MATRTYQAKRFNQDKSDPVRDNLTVEEALQIAVNGTPFTVSMRTPGNDTELITGLLHSEGVIRDHRVGLGISFKENTGSALRQADVRIPEDGLGDGYFNSRSLLSVSSCGICGRTELTDLKNSGKPLDVMLELDLPALGGLFEKMNHRQFDFNRSGGTHAAAAFSANGSLICVQEDIGRHNAVDKVIGWLIINDRMGDAKVLTVSGRVSYEIVVKCFKGRIPCLAAVSAPSSLAVDFAKELGITLFGFCRENRATCYSHVGRIKENYTEELNSK